MKTPKDIVKEGYNKVSYAYREDNPDKSGENYQQYKTWIDELSPKIKEGAAVLDLGCGCGVPTSQLLSQKFNVTGADLSPVQINRAKKLVPNATFICSDMCKLSFPPETFNAVVCFYAIIHVPIEEQQALLKNVWKWIKPNGYFLLITGHRAWTGQEKNWLDVEGGTMYWSQGSREDYISWLKNAKFNVLWDRFIPEGNGGHTLMLAQKENG